MNGDAVFVLAIVGMLLLEATNYAFGGDRLVAAQAWAFMARVMLALLGLPMMPTTRSAGPFIYALFSLA